MAPRLTPCASCARFVRADEQACPFCAAPLAKTPTGRAALAGAVVLTAALSLGGKCGEPEVAAAYGAAPTGSTAPVTSATSVTSAPPATAVPAYGLPPTATPTATTTPTVAASGSASAAPSTSSSAAPPTSSSAKTKLPPQPSPVAVPAYGLPPTAPKPSR